MESNKVVDEHSLVSRENSAKDKELTDSKGSLKSIKSEKQHNAIAKSESIKSAITEKVEKDVHTPKISFKTTKDKVEFDNQDLSAKVPHKFIANWKQACDRTRDRTRDLLKRWRTMPEYAGVENTANQSPKHDTNGEKSDGQGESCGWSVHVWTTWVDRFSIDNTPEENWTSLDAYQLTPIQVGKFSHFFSSLLDHDKDDLVGEQDFEILCQRLRHFADWSTNSAEFNILREVERGFVSTFLQPTEDKSLGFEMKDQRYVTHDGWLHHWAHLVSGAKNLNDFPLWLQYFVRVLFQVINRSGSGVISRDELSCFYSSVLGMETVKVGEIIDLAFQAMTSNGDHLLNFHAYRLCFSNYLLARYPNGPGQFFFGAPPPSCYAALFPVDYSALNTSLPDLEQYTPDQQTNRHSVVV